ncbi:MAG: MFS transporter [Gammaproteobacteria bacterium]|nr:MFS transporter [Gammaproteobacteria bacterium]
MSAERRFDPVHIGWSVGTLGVSLQLNTFAVMVLFFLVTVLKIEPVIAGALITGSKLYDAITDPLMGAISDRTRTRWGRRRPYLMIGGLGCGLSFALLFAIPPMSDPMMLYIYVGAALILLSTFYTIFNVPYLTMPAEMIDDYHERSVMMSYRVFLISVGTLIGVSAAPAMPTWFEEGLGLNEPAAYRLMGAIIGGLMSAAMVASFFGTARARFTDPVRDSMPLGQKIQLMLSNTPFLLYLGLKLAGLFSLAAVLASQLFFVVYIMERSPAVVAIFGLAQFAAQIVTIPMWLQLSKRTSKTYILVLASIATLLISATWFLSGPGEPLWVYGLRGVLLGIAAAGTLLGTQAILPDIMEYDYRRTGLRREGIYAGMASFIEKISSAFAGVVIGGFLSAMAFDKELPPGEQPESALLAILICMAVIPMATLAIKLICLYFFKLDERTLKSTGPVAGSS